MEVRVDRGLRARIRRAGSCGWVNMWPACGPWFEDVRADIDRHGADAPGIRSEVLVAEDRQAV